MNFRSRPLRKAALAVALASTVASGLLVTTASADINTNPPWQEAAAKDPNAVRTLNFYDANGNQVTSGSTTAAFPFVAASGTVRAGDDHATLFVYTPVAGTPAGAWSGTQLTATATYPIASPPAALPTGVPALKGISGAAGDKTLAQHIADYPNASSTAGYQGVYEVRLRTSSNTAGVADQYAVSDIVVSGTTWTVYGSKIDSVATATVPTTGTYGTSFQVPVTVTGAGATPTGTVTVKEGSTAVSSATNLDP
ncbi:MAG: hypothetical protein ACJ72D_29585, partial [Marmoricola sp.]